MFENYYSEAVQSGVAYASIFNAKPGLTFGSNQQFWVPVADLELTWNFVKSVCFYKLLI